ncbi:hypothetical protein [Amycolatopsis nalaikhensis]|uniref:Uncharacterized protein n=1 Tax=Amycolatopsis nalaikhensis TaxID=715472 RepID=A0ABY8XUS0_9PSEU|nr:hypothetical protein [Amycolatopsis sp. 2-2]WIV59231.1 hypothetical protein QP939_11670 [Amycolatopsis sp. 2-2]
MTSENPTFDDFPAEVYAGSIVAFFQHGLLIVEDAASQAVHESWDAASERTHFDDDSLFVAVRPHVDGPVRVDVFVDEIPEKFADGLVECFDGVLPLRSGVVCVHDSDDLVRLTRRISVDQPHFGVLVNDTERVDRVLVVLYDR